MSQADSAIVKNWAGKKVSNVTTCNSKWKYYGREYMSFLRYWKSVFKLCFYLPLTLLYRYIHRKTSACCYIFFIDSRNRFQKHVLNCKYSGKRHWKINGSALHLGIFAATFKVWKYEYSTQTCHYNPLLIWNPYWL